MNTRNYYEHLFHSFPDVVNTETFCKMLGIGMTLAWKLIREKHIQSIHYMEQSYIIPKVWVIDYVLGDHYSKLKGRLKNQV